MTEQGAVSASFWQQDMFASGPLSDGRHIVTVTCINAGAANQLFIDLILFLPSADATSVGILLIDDTDSRISYSTGWVLAGSAAEYKGTTLTVPPGNYSAKYTAVLNFTGQYQCRIYMIIIQTYRDQEYQFKYTVQSEQIMLQSIQGIHLQSTAVIRRQWIYSHLMTVFYTNNCCSKTMTLMTQTTHWS